MEARNLAPLPSSIDHIQGAALPLAGLTAWQGLFVHGRLETGQTVLIHGAAGGVGSLAVQLAVDAGACVIGTGRTGDRQTVLDLGAEAFIDLAREPLDGSADVVFDVIGGGVLERPRRRAVAAERADNSSHAVIRIGPCRVFREQRGILEIGASGDVRYDEFSAHSAVNSTRPTFECSGCRVFDPTAQARRTKRSRSHAPMRVQRVGAEFIAIGPDEALALPRGRSARSRHARGDTVCGSHGIDGWRGGKIRISLRRVSNNKVLIAFADEINLLRLGAVLLGPPLAGLIFFS